MPEGSIGRVNILGVGVHSVNMESALSCLEESLNTGKRGYVCVTGVHGVMEAGRDEGLRGILNSALLNVPDGMPLVWFGKMKGQRDMGRVYGPDLMAGICERSVAKGWSHFLYGGKEGVAPLLAETLMRRFPGFKMVGTYTPPFRPLTGEEENELSEMVERTKPDIMWIGLSTPKQERFMAEHNGKLKVKCMLGVGAAFDIHTGCLKDAPAWMKRAGLQWLHRFFQEPRRLWKRYLLNNPVFVMKLALQILGIRRYSL